MNVPGAISHYLDRLSAGDADGAFFGLLELRDLSVEDLIKAYSREGSIQRRMFLLRVISERRQHSCLRFLVAQLSDEDPSIWRKALDGLVLIASPASLEAMQEVRSHCAPAKLKEHKFGVWLDEAISQVSERITP